MKSGMKILIVTAMFPPIRTGASFYSKNLAESLQKRGNKVTVVTLRNKEAHDKDYPFKVHRLSTLSAPFKNYFKHFRISSFFIQNYLKMNRIAKRTKPDVILLVNHYLDIAFPAVFTSRLRKIPLICSVGTQLQSISKSRDKILNILDRVICGSLIFPFCHKIIAWDTQILQYLKDVHSKNTVNKSVIINYGVNGNYDFFLNYRHNYDLHKQILGVGPIIEPRNFLPLILAFKGLTKDYPDLRLKIIGPVYYDKAVKLSRELGLSRQVLFTGELPHEDVLNEFTKSDVFFVSLTGKYLGLGTATIEAMLLGVPTIANIPQDLLGGPQLIDMQNIIYSDGLSVEKLESKIRQLLTDSDLRQKIGQGERGFIKEHLSWEKISGQVEDLFSQVSAHHEKK